MSEFIFKIPLKLEELTTVTNDVQRFVVSQEYTQREVIQYFNEIEDQFKTYGSQFILENFDKFYSLLKGFKSFDYHDKNLYFKLIYESLESLKEELSKELYNTRSHLIVDASERHKHCNILKMHITVLCAFIDLFEEEASKKVVNSCNKNSENKKKSLNEDWDKEIQKGIELIMQTIALPLHHLLTSPTMEEEISGCVLRCCWRVLENPSTVRDKQLSEKVFNILGNSVEKYRQSLGFCLKIIQLLQHRENMVNVLANLVECVVKKHHQRIIICEIMREIERIDIKDLSKDSSGPRAISHFLSEVAERCPNEMMPCIPNFLSFLDQDSYPMRSATLIIIGIVVSNVLSKDNLNFTEKKLRDELLDKLENHIMDITSFTRGRALQVWSRLFMEKKVPLTRLNSLIEEVVGRLQDKSSYVRKNAVQLLNYFLKYNPLADELNCDVLKDVYLREKNYLAELVTFKSNFENTGNFDKQCDNENLIKVWSKLESQLILCYQSNSGLTDLNQEDMDSDNIDVDLLINMSRSLLEENFIESIKTYNLMKENFPNHEIFNYNKQFDDQSKTEEDDDDDEEWKEITKMAAVFKKIFFDKSLDHSKDEYNAENLKQEIEKAVLFNSNKNQYLSTKTNFSEMSFESLESLIKKQQTLMRYINDLIKISEKIQTSIPLVCTLLHSKNIQDVQEAIEFFVTAYKFGLKKEAYVGIRKMIVLIFSSEVAKKSAVIDAYKKLFINPSNVDELNYYEKANIVVKNLIEILSEASFEEVISLQELLKNLMSSNDIDKFTLRVLWEKYTLKSPETSQEESRLAIQIISMIASSNHNIIRDNIDTLITTGLGDRALNDLQLVRYTCTALNKSVINQGSIVTTELPFRLPKNHILFSKLSDILVSSLPKLELENWFPMSDEAIKVIFNLAENPDSICESINQRLVKFFLKFKISTDNVSSPNSKSIFNENESETNKNINETSDKKTDDVKELSSNTKKRSFLNDTLVDAKILARFISLIGSISLNLLVHLEVNIFTEMKTRNVIKEEKENHKRNSSATKISIKRKKAKPINNGDDDILDLSEFETEDAEAELISNICNNDILGAGKKNENLLAKLSKMIIQIATDSSEYFDPMLKAAASLALAKSMAISEKFCSSHLRILFTILSRSKEPIIRSNTIIGIGDLCVRFPNLLDPWTPNLYQSLRDPCVAVRTCALKVLSRLILSDMIKVKEQISEIAKLTVDSEKDLSNFAKLFFNQLSKKQNAIYNILPDIISNLSDLKVGIEENNFKQVMKFIFELIDKEKHTVGLVEKLCQRFRGTTDERQWLNLTYCLSLLNYTDKSIAKLFENFVCFADKVQVDEVYDLFQSIIANAKKLTNLRTETKQILDEFESKLILCKNRGENEDINSLLQTSCTIVSPLTPKKRSNEIKDLNDSGYDSANKRSRKKK